MKTASVFRAGAVEPKTADSDYTFVYICQKTSIRTAFPKMILIGDGLWQRWNHYGITRQAPNLTAKCCEVRSESKGVQSSIAKYRL